MRYDFGSTIGLCCKKRKPVHITDHKPVARTGGNHSQVFQLTDSPVERGAVNPETVGQFGLAYA